MVMRQTERLIKRLLSAQWGCTVHYTMPSRIEVSELIMLIIIIQSRSMLFSGADRQLLNELVGCQHALYFVSYLIFISVTKLWSMQSFREVQIKRIVIQRLNNGVQEREQLQIRSHHDQSQSRIHHRRHDIVCIRKLRQCRLNAVCLKT